MGRVVMMMSESLDGHMEGPGRDISWHQVDEEVHTHFNDVLRGAGAFLGGRVTYELMAAFWPTADEDPEAPASIRDFAGIWRAMPKVVYSRTLDRVDEGATLVREVVPDDVRRLAADADGDLFLGGANLAATFLALDLVDELRLYRHPVLLGGGTRTFPDASAATWFRLIESRTFGNGVVLTRYERAHG
jgi:dihydrofolate reductase